MYVIEFLFLCFFSKRGKREENKKSYYFWVFLSVCGDGERYIYIYIYFGVYVLRHVFTDRFLYAPQTISPQRTLSLRENHSSTSTSHRICIRGSTQWLWYSMVWSIRTYRNINTLKTGFHIFFLLFLTISPTDKSVRWYVHKVHIHNPAGRNKLGDNTSKSLDRLECNYWCIWCEAQGRLWRGNDSVNMVCVSVRRNQRILAWKDVALNNPRQHDEK